MKIGVTGATGQLGRLVVQELLKSVPAQDLVAIVRNKCRRSKLWSVSSRASSANSCSFVAGLVSRMSSIGSTKPRPSK